MNGPWYGAWPAAGEAVHGRSSAKARRTAPLTFILSPLTPLMIPSPSSSPPRGGEGRGRGERGRGEGASSGGGGGGAGSLVCFLAGRLEVELQGIEEADERLLLGAAGGIDAGILHGLGLKLARLVLLDDPLQPHPPMRSL